MLRAFKKLEPGWVEIGSDAEKPVRYHGCLGMFEGALGEEPPSLH